MNKEILAVIVSGGNIDTDFALDFLQRTRWDVLIGADRGAGFLLNQGIMPTHVVGDFDSAGEEIRKTYRQNPSIEMREFQPEKDLTDTQIAVELALSLGSTRIILLGATGSRLDHVLGNIQVMMLPLERGAECEILDTHNRIYLKNKGFSLEKEKQYGKFISLIPFTPEVYPVTLTGFKYPLNGATLRAAGSLGISNEIQDAEAKVEFAQGILIVAETRD